MLYVLTIINVQYYDGISDTYHKIEIADYITLSSYIINKTLPWHRKLPAFDLNNHNIKNILGILAGGLRYHP